MGSSAKKGLRFSPGLPLKFLLVILNIVCLSLHMNSFNIKMPGYGMISTEFASFIALFSTLSFISMHVTGAMDTKGCLAVFEGWMALLLSLLHFGAGALTAAVVEFRIKTMEPAFRLIVIFEFVASGFYVLEALCCYIFKKIGGPKAAESQAPVAAKPVKTTVKKNKAAVAKPSPAAQPAPPPAAPPADAPAAPVQNARSPVQVAKSPSNVGPSKSSEEKSKDGVAPPAPDAPAV